ncbi:BadF/BadG/BcrA/BcrD ATPase family protein [Ktedonospora formicarum]|uniref:N-acetylglucosamine kinase n=1 Tax=Ktedonospora formicarum TaxID=2778364 RepID=A0A8J3HWL2_9CHLR|nr:BadF/BadG/BcrA/BcrD ATPase family protein [Ktedonospora formicarum]GHO43351.1 N-acetylglucosamine kinase [Ktedonospora formicarum]
MTGQQNQTDPVCYLGIDGGGSKTQAILVDTQGLEIGRGQAGSSNYAAVGLTKAVEHITNAVTQARAQIADTYIVSKAWIGLAGIDTPQGHTEMLPHLQALAREVLLTNDAELGLSALPQAVGVVLIAGTGSIGLGRDQHGQIQRAGGWGHILGDEGSGYALGQRALQAAVRFADGRGPATSLLKQILSHWQLTEPYELITKVYPGEEKAMIARLSICVIQAASEGDAIASTILKQAANELAMTVCAVVRKLNFAAQKLPLALSGGLLIHEHIYRELVLAQLHQQFKALEVTLVNEPALSAAKAAIHLDNLATWKRA